MVRESRLPALGDVFEGTLLGIAVGKDGATALLSKCTGTEGSDRSVPLDVWTPLPLAGDARVDLLGAYRFFAAQEEPDSVDVIEHLRHTLFLGKVIVGKIEAPRGAVGRAVALVATKIDEALLWLTMVDGRQ
jgi:hypothetical protein